MFNIYHNVCVRVCNVIIVIIHNTNDIQDTSSSSDQSSSSSQSEGASAESSTSEGEAQDVKDEKK